MSGRLISGIDAPPLSRYGRARFRAARRDPTGLLASSSRPGGQSPAHHSTPRPCSPIPASRVPDRSRRAPPLPSAGVTPRPISRAAARLFLVRRHFLAPPRSLPPGPRERARGLRATRPGPVRPSRGRRPQSRPGPWRPDRRLPARDDRRPALRRARPVRGLQQEPEPAADARAAVVPPHVGPLPGDPRKGHVRDAQGARRRDPRTDPQRRSAERDRFRDARPDRLVMAPDEPGARHPRGAGDVGRPRVGAATGQPALLRLRGAAVLGRAPRRHRPDPREQRRHRLLSRYRAHGMLGRSGSAEALGRRSAGEADGTYDGPLRGELLDELVDRGELLPVLVDGVRGDRFVLPEEVALLDVAERDAAVAGGDAGSDFGPTEAPAAGPRSTRGPPASPSWPRSTSSSGTATSCGRCSTSTTSGRSTSRSRNAGGATTCCRSCGAIVSSAESSRGSTANRTPSASSGCIGRPGSDRPTTRRSSPRSRTPWMRIVRLPGVGRVLLPRTAALAPLRSVLAEQLPALGRAARRHTARTALPRECRRGPAAGRGTIGTTQRSESQLPRSERS